MSAFDLDRITESLRSSKIKSRNDALNLLAGLTASKLKLHPRHFTMLTSGLIQLIEIERGVFANNSSNPVVSRLSIASTFLRDLMEEELKNAPRKPRYKHCLSIVNSIKSCYFIGPHDLPLEPCAVTFSQILKMVLLENLVRTHLTVDAWLKIYNFLRKAIDGALDENRNLPSSNESLLCNLLESLLLVLGGDSSLTYLPIYQDRAYFPLLRLCKRCLRACDKRESPVLIACFKLINKLVIMLATEDASVCHELIKHALKSIIQFASTPVEPLFIHFCIFLNLDPVHRYFNILNLPKLTTVDISMDDDLTLESASRVGDDDMEVQLYTAGMLIQELLSRLGGLVAMLGPDQVIIQDNPHVDWFRLPHISYISDTASLWLLLTGLAKLVNSYFTLRAELSDSFHEKSLQSGKHFTSSTADGFANKRQKLKDPKTKLWASETPLQFYTSLATKHEDNRIQVCGIQLLTIHFELFENHSESMPTRRKQDEDHSTSWNLNESTILDLNYDSSPESKLLPCLRLMLRLLSESTNVFWALVCSRSLLKNLSLDIGRERQSLTKLLHQLLKLLIPRIKEKEFSSVATSIIVDIILVQSDSDLDLLADETLKSQLINITDLADLAGPAVIDGFSLKFWWCLHRMLRGAMADQTLASSVDRWFTSKFSDAIVTTDSETSKFTPKNIPHPHTVSQILLWLSGTERISMDRLHSERLSPCSEEYSNIYSEMMREAGLQVFIALTIAREPGISRNQLECLYVQLLTMSCPPKVGIARIQEASEHVVRSGAPLEAIASWAVFLSNMLDVDLIDRLPEVDSLRLCLREVWDLVASEIQSSKQALHVIKLVLKDSILPKTLRQISFPAEKILSHVRVHHRSLLDGPDDSDFDDFLSSSISELRRSKSPSPESSMELLDAFKFRVLYGGGRLEDHIRQLEIVETRSLLPCLKFYASYLESANMIQAEKSSLFRLVRLIGEGPLSNQSLDRDDLTIAVCCDIVRLLLPICKEVEMKSLQADLLDLLNYLSQCIFKGLFLTDVKVVSFWNMFLCLSDTFVDPGARQRLMSTFFEDFEDFPNRLKMGVSEVLTDALAQSDSLRQMNIYRELFQRFANPQSSIERCATYCLFFSQITRKGGHLRTAALFNFVECAKFDCLKPYLRETITSISVDSNEKTSRRLFLTSKLELLKNWAIYNHDIFEYPYDLFGYSDLSSFLSENYRDITAILIAVKSTSRTTPLAELTKIAKIKASDVESVICDSLSLIVPLAYTSDGIRNAVFKTLAEMLHLHYKVHMKQKLNLIILETVGFTDFRDEKAFSTLLSGVSHSECFNSEVKIETSAQTVVSPNSSLELINALISKFWTLDNDRFWIDESCYFFIRQLGRRALTRQIHGKVMFLRSIKYLLCLSKLPLASAKLFELVVESCISLNMNLFDTDIYSIWNLFDISHLFEMDEQRPMRTIFRILCKICESNTLLEKTAFIDKLSLSFHRQATQFNSYGVLVNATLNLCQGKPVTISFTDFEDFLKDIRSRIDFNYDLEVVLHLFSQLLQYATEGEVKTAECDLVKLFMSMDLSSANEGIKLWISLYLSHFYLSGSFEKVADTIVDNKEFYTSNNDELSKSIGRMDFFLELLMSDLKSAGFGRVAFVETILGSLLWKYETKKSEVQKFMNFERFYQQFKEFLIPMDFHSCILINSPEGEFEIECVALDAYARDFSTLLLNSSSEQWMSQLLLSVIQEVATYTSLASLLASYVLKFPDVAGKLLPSLLCLYISLSGKTGAGKIGGLLASFWKYFREPHDHQAIEMIKDTVLLVRAGARLEIEVFKSFYDTLNKSDLGLIVQEGSFSRSALMLLEDSQDQSTDLKILNSHLGLIYESLDDEDLFQGLPEDPSVEHALKLVSRLGSSAEKVHYSSGQLDALIFLTGSSSGKQFALSLIDDGQLGMSGALEKTSQKDERSYEWAWKLNLWNIPAPQGYQDKHGAIYSYFKQIHESTGDADNIYKKLALKVLEETRDADVINKTQSRVRISQVLETLSILETLNSIMTRSGIEFKNEVGEFEKTTLWFEKCDLEYSEDLLRARQIAYNLHGTKLSSNDFCSMPSFALSLRDLTLQGFASNVVRAIDLFRSNKQVQKMISSTVLLEQCVKTSEFQNRNVQDELMRLSKFQFAKTFWESGKTNVSVAILRDVIQGGSIDLSLDILNVDSALVSATLAKWLVESRQSLGSTVFSQIIDPMKEHLMQMSNSRQKGEVYHLLAQFCEQQFKSKTLLDQLGDISMRVQDNRKEIEEIKAHYSRTSVSSAEKKTVQKYYNRLKSQALSEESELEVLNHKRELFARNAAKFYLASLLLGDEFSSDMDNFFSLFLELANDSELQDDLLADLKLLPTFKPLSWCTQLLSRISNDESPFQNSVRSLIMRICENHPFHSLYYLISLIKHEEISKESSNLMMSVRVEAAKQLREKLASESQLYNLDVLLPIERLSEQCIILSEHKCSKGRKLDLEKLKMGHYWMNELPSIPPPTLDIPVSCTGYELVPRMVSLMPKISIATSGLSLPKIATFVLSDGTLHKMLLKHGTDDLRQDATMEQVFNKVNHIFSLDKEARKRHLRVRTYKAVPLGPKAGVIEFVLNSKALIEVIRPYHQKFDNLKSEAARGMMKDCQTNEVSDRLKVYRDITTQIQPVLRHYFTDNFISPDAWFRSRQIYTRGIATSSMVGHILGLGDRHCNNILLDEFTGEPIHIDLGVAFDQGKRLPIPETVPFRLTRDIVDGFGISGTRGSFGKVCEHSFRVLRSNKERILAILDVLRWDPLHSWSISPIRKKKLQEENGAFGVLAPHDHASEAGAALLTVLKKINADGLSVEATVLELIHEATSEENLAVIYCGWCPFF